MLKESDLYDPLKKYLEKQGYSVSSEVHECDMVAVKDEDMIIIELKTRVSVALLVQAARRKDIADSVYVAVPVRQGKKEIPGFSGIKHLLARLEVGLILVRFMKTKTKIETVIHPRPFEQRMRRKKKTSLLTEIDGRYAEFQKGGIESGEEKLTAYKQEALKTALILRRSGPLSLSELRNKGVKDSKIRSILSGNHYGWFEKVKRGVYELGAGGREALMRYEETYPDIADIILPSKDS